MNKQNLFQENIVFCCFREVKVGGFWPVLTAICITVRHSGLTSPAINRYDLTARRRLIKTDWLPLRVQCRAAGWGGLRQLSPTYVLYDESNAQDGKRSAGQGVRVAWERHSHEVGGGVKAMCYYVMSRLFIAGALRLVR